MLVFCALPFIVLGTVRSCSPPVGGFVEPTEAELVFYADYVVTGKVTKIIRPDPVMPYETTYGAQVQISCQYKGENISREIIIIGAGFIPGHCTANDLKQNMEFIMFLSQKNGSYFQQTHTAHNITAIRVLLQVCDLKLKYPVGLSADFPKVRCQAPNTTTECKRYTPPPQVRPTPAGPPSTQQVVTHAPKHVENVQIADKESAQRRPITTTPSGAATSHLLSSLSVLAIVLQALLFF